MFGQYKRLTNRYEAGVLTGNGLFYGGSGYGNTYFTRAMLQRRGNDSDGKTVGGLHARGPPMLAFGVI
ncbi:hypothetical protein RAH32_09310 [Paracoccus sp. WLY502]|uniref:hypothetical protein n=1 Tax=Paracoccus yibinensis TaxID=3068891 RepID=UPI0027967572|nr:hypothetical protein [Paracoccus sp. WLY502]MDQ1900636.1 hypothetical protein [Paracoccus sp. WLY502]